MARTLVVKNADFSVNKLTTVIFNDIPCTGISLDKSTLTMTSVGSTSTITATVTPSDTTDAVIWSSSNTDVCTVAGGVVTQTGCGTATITATCGNYTATCTVTATHIADLTFALNTYCSQDPGADYVQGGSLNNYAIGYSPVGSIRIYSISSGGDGKYPYVIPLGANKITINCIGFKPYGFWLSSTQAGTGGGRAKAYEVDDNFKYNSNISDSRIVPIPDRTSGTYEGMDACVFVFRYMNGTISDAAVANITVTFTAE